jgi:hypothetical protein
MSDTPLPTGDDDQEVLRAIERALASATPEQQDREDAAYSASLVGHVQVDGRGVRTPALTVRVMESRVVVQVDDEENPEYWHHITLSAEILVAWVREMGYTVVDDGQ